jgi:type IV secretory pathway VirB9-like protein
MGETLQGHIFVTVSGPGLTLGLIITSTRLTYYLTLTSVVRTPIRVVRWTYPVPEQTAGRPARPPGLLPDPDMPLLYHVGYVVLGSHEAIPWSPRWVGDDGRKTYLVLPEVTLFDTVPLVREVGSQGPQLLNVRQVLNVLIVDKLVGRLELRQGTGEQAQVVTITRGHLRTIQCPDAGSACPVWPAAARILAGAQR